MKILDFAPKMYLYVIAGLFLVLFLFLVSYESHMGLRKKLPPPHQAEILTPPPPPPKSFYPPHPRDPVHTYDYRATLSIQSTSGTTKISCIVWLGST